MTLAATLIAAVILWRPRIAGRAAEFAKRTGWCMLALAIAPIVLRLAMLGKYPVPLPDVYDEFSHLLVADTLRHFRLANPPHSLPQFFETFFVLQRPTYSSIYPIGQGLSLAIGWVIFRTPWAGVLLCMGAFCSLCYWMLRGWTTPGWALLGGVLAALEFGPLCQWTNSYWGGGYTAVAGCLVFGALPRLRKEYRSRDAAMLGLGLGMHLLSRPFESIFLLLSVAVFFLPAVPGRLLKPAIVAALVCLPAIALVLIDNKQVTGNWTTLPYQLSQYQYGVPASFTFQPHLLPHNALTHEQEMDYRMQRAFRNADTESFGRYLQRLVYRIRFYRFYFYPVLYVALAIFVTGVREYRLLWVVLTVLIFALGTNFYPLFLPHYVAAVTCLFILMSVEGLRRLSLWPSGMDAVKLLVCLCIIQFAWSWVTQPRAAPEQRIAIHRQLAAMPGQLLVFVRYWPQHIFQNEWVYNDADIDRARVVWARDLGDAENDKLRRYYPNRSALLLEPDARPPRLGVYRPEPAKPEAPPEEPKEKTKPNIIFENVNPR